MASERPAARQGPGEVAVGGAAATWRGRGWRCGCCLARRRTGREEEPAAEGEGPARRAGRGRRLGADGGGRPAAGGAGGGCTGGESPRRLWLLLESKPNLIPCWNANLNPKQG
jgi:hypothetical protein